VVRVTDRECLCQGELEGNILAVVIPHAIGTIRSIRFAMSGQPLVHLAAVPRLVLHCPGVAGGGNLLCAALAGVKMKGKHVSTRIDCIRLVEDRFPVGQCESGWIRESADAAERSKIVVEGPVFLHQQDHMFDVFQRAAS
jgi:hypothetical protein